MESNSILNRSDIRLRRWIREKSGCPSFKMKSSPSSMQRFLTCLLISASSGTLAVSYTHLPIHRPHEGGRRRSGRLFGCGSRRGLLRRARGGSRRGRWPGRGAGPGRSSGSGSGLDGHILHILFYRRFGQIPYCLTSLIGLRFVLFHNVLHGKKAARRRDYDAQRKGPVQPPAPKQRSDPFHSLCSLSFAVLRRHSRLPRRCSVAALPLVLRQSCRFIHVPSVT